MGAYMGVAKGSLEEHGPKFIHLTYKPPQTPTKKVAIVGKGLTFDSGGYVLALLCLNITALPPPNSDHRFASQPIPILTTKVQPEGGSLFD
jgi:hypothetical protein